MASQTKLRPSLLTGAAGTAASVPPVSAPAGTHLWFVDHLRIVLICGVVVAHVSSIYAGGWYQYHEPVPPDVLTRYVLGIPDLIANMFGMGFFFLLAGYFTPGSYDRKGGVSFVRDRLVRLGIPLLLYDLLLDPLVVYLARGMHGSYWNFYGPYLLQVRTIAPVVAWFIATLLLFTLLYAAWRWLTRKRSHAAHGPATLPSTRAILGFIVALILVSFVVRLWWPLRWDWSLIALIAILVAVPIMAFGAATGMLNYFLGGFHWQALVLAMWEAFMVVGVCIGSLVLFRLHWNQ